MRAIRFVVFSESSLAHFKPFFFRSRQLHVPIFKCSLVRPSSCVSGCNYIFKSLWEIIHLKRKPSHTIHLILKFSGWRLGPNFLTFIITSLKKNFAVPISSNFNFFIFLFSFLNENRAFKLKCFIWKPASALKFYLAFFVGPIKICHRQGLSNIDVQVPDQEVVSA